MGRLSTLSLAIVLMACRADLDPAPAVLTLLPAAFAGGTQRDEQLCLTAGQEAVAAVWIHAPTVTFTVRGRAVGDGVLAIALGAEAVGVEPLPGDGPIERTYQAAPSRGQQMLRFGRPAGVAGEVCLSQVALTQP